MYKEEAKNYNQIDFDYFEEEADNLRDLKDYEEFLEKQKEGL